MYPELGLQSLMSQEKIEKVHSLLNKKSPCVTKWLESGPIMVDVDQASGKPILTNLCDYNMKRFYQDSNGFWISKSDGSVWKLTPNFDLVPALMNLKGQSQNILQTG